MCMGVPARVVERGDFDAWVDVMGSRMRVGIIFVPEVRVGDYVIVHAGQAMSVISEEYAKASMEAWRLIADAGDS
ncbi:hydrogenase expression/formation protein HypC [Planifilum fulgidum]|uniref:Hydrogenase expression/formation protein HypC n=1 Tax=Planifilum fulgidum TaxID=201973 RepID=A0A1I2Q1U8_9BACL|nr:HypC/HybG/HupF family hydrogenase formation chaperone [Planifilum fulgidum]SFG22332.1 hydrogenase expression/formation protein HypC [Planifilum fulgidum]